MRRGAVDVEHVGGQRPLLQELRRWMRDGCGGVRTSGHRRATRAAEVWRRLATTLASVERNPKPRSHLIRNNEGSSVCGARARWLSRRRALPPSDCFPSAVARKPFARAWRRNAPLCGWPASRGTWSPALPSPARSSRALQPVRCPSRPRASRRFWRDPRPSASRRRRGTRARARRSSFARAAWRRRVHRPLARPVTNIFSASCRCGELDGVKALGRGPSKA